MTPAAKLFYLTVFSLFGGHAQCESINTESGDDNCAISPRAIVSDACASYSTLEQLNIKVKPAVDELTRETDFFSHYRLNLQKTCPFWDDENSMCGNIACAVSTIENEDDIPEVWRAKELGKLEGPLAKHPGKTVQKERPERPLQGSLGENVGESCVVEYDDECDERDYCVPEDESAGAKGDYVSLIQNPERFTGYGGESAKTVWDAIYRENCFQKSSFPHSAALGLATAKGPAVHDFRAVLQDANRQQVLEQQRSQGLDVLIPTTTGFEFEDECLEKRVFYRVISGMHASISTHICQEYFNQTTGTWQPNMQCYLSRLHTHPERISNLYFNYALLTRAIAKIGPYLKTYTFCTGDADQDAATQAMVLAVTQNAASVPQIFDESLMFKNGEGPSLKEDFRNRFRNVSRIMDCVGCDKCRLWGKVQTIGYGTALKVLFEFDNESNEVPELKKTELVALFNTYARLSSSMDALRQFRDLVDVENVPTGEEGKEKTSQPIPDRAKKPHAVVPEQQESKDEEPDEWEGSEQKAWENSTIREQFDEEFGRVLLAFKIVVRSWIRLPGILWNILISELNRAWEFYIGLPVTPRTWRLERPNLDEL